MVQLLQLAVDDGWTEDAAAPELRQRVPDQTVLQLAQATHDSPLPRCDRDF